MKENEGFGVEFVVLKSNPWVCVVGVFGGGGHKEVGVGWGVGAFFFFSPLELYNC